MKKIICLLMVLEILVLGSVVTFADPWGELGSGKEPTSIGINL